ncbi:MAG TPA: hypothetical protein GXZ26_06890 [Firmicutes bacterium]|nr:hypothetical protein [Bacillota bacterium]
MEKLLRIFFPFFLLFPLLAAGCLQKPYYPGRDYGELKIRLVLAEEAAVTAPVGAAGTTTAINIEKILIQLSHGKGKLTHAQEIPYVPDQPMEASFSSLYPGKWQVTAEAYEERFVVLYCSREVTIEPGSSNTAELYLTTAPGFLDFTFDGSEFPGFGTEVTGGKLYAYLNPKNNQSTSFPLTREGDRLTGLIKLPAGTFQVRVVIPQISTKEYESPYYTVHIFPGRTVELTVGPYEELIIEGTIDFPPEKPGQLILSQEEPDEAGSVTIHLSWAEVSVADLGGYRLYRTNAEGRFVHLAEVDPHTRAYTDTVAPGAYYDGRVGYAVSSFDLGGNESLWSEPVYLDKPGENSQ